MEIKNLIIDPTPKTPQIELNPLSGDLLFSGRSIPENAAKIYEPAFNWVNQYIQNPRPTTNFRFNMEYYNTASSLWIAKILKVLINIPDADCTLIIHLYLPMEDYEDIEEFADIKDAFFPLSDIFHGAIPSIVIKLYGTDDDGKVVRDTLVYM
jgi:hypothetical protein